MKRSILYFLSFFCLTPLAARTSQPVVTVQPASWWSGMKDTSLQIMLHGGGVGESEVSVSARGVRMDSVFRPANSNYLFLYLNVADTAPQTFKIGLKSGKKVSEIPYELKERDNALRAQGFSQADVVYLLMPDRFANGNLENDVAKGMREAVSSQQPDARHGGDLAGMTQALDYLSDLGVTAVWPTPLLINDMPSTSYHGYAITDYYQTDPRYGTNEEYRAFVSAAHERGLKVIQDMVFNHCGSENFLFTDRPDSTWFNYGGRYVQTSYKILSCGDPHASSQDARNAQDGWFVESMPDFNQRNPHVLKYLVQNSIWWIEYAGIDGIRQDTYPYIDREASSHWCEAVMGEYPNFNIVGETWLGNNVGVSFWQKDSPLAGGAANSQLPTVMDFPLMDLLNCVLDEESDDWGKGLARIYNYLAQDAVFADPARLLTFLSNHDTDRFARNVSQAERRSRYRQALTLLLTLRGIPQLYYGDELAMAADKSKGDGALRQNFPGGFPGDTVNAFKLQNLTPLMRETLDFTRRLLQWRKGCEAIGKGTLKQFAVTNGIYVYAREYHGHTVTVLLNGTSRPASVALGRYAEVLPKTAAREIISGRTVSLREGAIEMESRGALVLDFDIQDASARRTPTNVLPSHVRW